MFIDDDLIEQYREQSQRTAVSPSKDDQPKTVITSEYHRDSLVLLKPYKTVPDVNETIFDNFPIAYILERAFQTLEKEEYVALDVETCGTEPQSKDCRIVGIGLSNLKDAYYFNLKTYTESQVKSLLIRLSKIKSKLIAHNLFFDASFIWVLAEKHGLNGWTSFPWTYCTYALSKYLAGEGYLGQEWGLKHFQKTLLMWEETNETALDSWLVAEGHGKLWRKQADTNNYWSKKMERWGKPDKSQMWRAPSSILGHYCMLDCLSTVQFFNHVLKPVLRRFTALENFMEGPYLTLFEMLIWQKLEGFAAEREGIRDYSISLQKKLDDLLEGFFKHQKIAAFIEEFNQSERDKLLAKEPTKYKVRKVGAEPVRLTKAGEVSKNWLKWKERSERPPEVSKSWLNWEEKWNENKDINHFNIGSAPSLRWLFYDKLGFPVEIVTKSGEPATDVKAQQGWGELGKLLITQSKLIKEKEYVDKAYLVSEESGRIHPSFKVPGTVTCRLGGSGGFSVHQQPKSPEYLKNFKPDEGYSWISSDFTSVEDFVLAELSRDVNLLKFYHPDSPPNDGYLFVGANLPIIGDKIRASGYDPENPTPESISHTKKVCKSERQTAKGIKLGNNYGLGPDNLWKDLTRGGLEITLEEVKALHSGYWELYAGVKKWEKELKKQWRNNKGWYLDGTGFPVCVDSDKTKDVMNRSVQKTAHTILILYIDIVVKMLRDREIPFKPIIIDLHDEINIQVPVKYTDKAVQVTQVDAVVELNRMLGGTLPLKMDTDVVSNWAEAKCE